MTDPSPAQAAAIDAYGVRLSTLDRWITVHTCIPEIQEAVKTGRLATGMAAELARLPAEAQAEIFALGFAACRSVARELRALRKRDRCPRCQQVMREQSEGESQPR